MDFPLNLFAMQEMRVSTNKTPIEELGGTHNVGQEVFGRSESLDDRHKALIEISEQISCRNEQRAVRFSSPFRRAQFYASKESCGEPNRADPSFASELRS